MNRTHTDSVTLNVAYDQSMKQDDRRLYKSSVTMTRRLNRN